MHPVLVTCVNRTPVAVAMKKQYRFENQSGREREAVVLVSVCLEWEEKETGFKVCWQKKVLECYFSNWEVGEGEGESYEQANCSPSMIAKNISVEDKRNVDVMFMCQRQVVF